VREVVANLALVVFVISATFLLVQIWRESKPKIQRYRLVDGLGMQKHPDGPYVKYSDIDK
jgi:phosphate starvation-inducible membrane PsiE